MANYRGQKRINSVPLNELLNPFAAKNVKQENQRIRQENDQNFRHDAKQVPDAPREYERMQPVPFGERLNIFATGPTQYANQMNQRENAVRFEQNRRLQQREDMMAGMPEFSQGNPYARKAVNFAETAGRMPVIPIAVAGAGLAAGGAGLMAYSDLKSEYAPADIGSVAGRAIKNVTGGFGTASVGVDPLMEARNNVAAARQLVGSENMLAALADDEITALRAEQDMSMTPTEFAQYSSVQQMIDNRAQQLQGTPTQRADGSVSPMPYDTAQRLASEQVAMELRANQVY
jgi:hypothetical protein